jgi:replication factor A1
MQETASKELDNHTKTLYFKSSGTLTWFSGDESKPYYYLACPSCKKKVVEEGRSYKCENCSKLFPDPVPTFNFSFKFSDYSGGLFLNCLGETGDQILGMSAAKFYKIFN